MTKRGAITFAEKYPELLSDWNFEENNKRGLSPYTLSYGCKTEVYWYCHTCRKTITGQIGNHHKFIDCKDCAKKKQIISYKKTVRRDGKNILAVTNPELLAEWDYEKNDKLGIFPYDITPKFDKDVNWKCKMGHSWYAKPAARTSKKPTGCPVCKKIFHSSFPEQCVYYYCKKWFNDAINSYNIKGEKKYSCDVYIPQLNVVVEYDGYRWHKDKVELDEQKDRYLISLGYKVIRLREDGLLTLNTDSKVFNVDRTNKSNGRFNSPICELLIYLGISEEIDIDVERDANEIYLQFAGLKIAKSFAVLYPDLSKEWDYNRNRGLRPENIVTYYPNKVWWICPNEECGKSYDAYPGARAKLNSGCPYCAGKKLIEGVNDLQTLYPDIARDWSPKNTKKANEVFSKSNSKAKWICPNHTVPYEARIVDRVEKGCGCNICSGKVVLKGFNDLATKNPDLAEEWDYEKNSPLTPFEVTAGSNKKVGWICSYCGRKWDNFIYRRNNGQGCRCKGIKVNINSPFCCS